MPQKIILDTDPGIDDAMAICFALMHPEIELLGLTTTFGNVSVRQATQNALTLLEMTGNSTIPVHAGASRPLHQPPPPYPDFVHGQDGFGNLHLPAPETQACQSTAAEFIISQVRQYPGEVSLIAIGPLSNLAQAVLAQADIAGQVKQVVIMGGTLYETGNVSPVAEANLFADPHAADIVMAAPWQVNMVGLDVTHQVLLSRALFAEIARHNPKIGGFLQQAAQFYIDFYEREREAESGCYGHDISAIAYALNPGLFTTCQGQICVATDGIACGQSMLNDKPGRHYALQHWDQRPQQQVCINVDAAGVVQLFRDTLCDYLRI